MLDADLIISDTTGSTYMEFDIFIVTILCSQGDRGKSPFGNTMACRSPPSEIHRAIFCKHRRPTSVNSDSFPSKIPPIRLASFGATPNHRIWAARIVQGDPSTPILRRVSKPMDPRASVPPENPIAPRPLEGCGHRGSEMSRCAADRSDAQRRSCLGLDQVACELVANSVLHPNQSRKAG
jgi:hypothetical protein